MFKAVLAGRQASYILAELAALAEHCTVQEDGARKVEGRMRKSGAALLLQSRVGQQHESIVNGSSARRLPRAGTHPTRVGSR
jgi:exoribonuclease-2